MIGGDLLGQGEYGCAVSKPLPCKYPHFIPGASSRDITKVGRPATLENEVRISKQIAVIPFARNYFILLKGSPCELSKKALDVDPELKSCKIIATKGLSAVEGVRMDYGGVSISEYRFNPVKFDLWAFGNRLLEACTILVTHGIVHWDLHIGNVLLDSYGIPRIIDFGLAISRSVTPPAEAVTDLVYPYDPAYTQHPPELALFNGRLEKRSVEFMLRDIFDGPRKKRTLHLAQLLLGVTREEQDARLQSFVKESEAFLQGDLEAYWRHYWTKLDAWSCGHMLMYVMYTMLKLGYDLNPVYVKHSVMMKDVMRCLLDVDPRKRYDVVDALARWNPTSPILHKYGRQWLAAKTSQ
jgi:serine/threonine protein kinase